MKNVFLFLLQITDCSLNGGNVLAYAEAELSKFYFKVQIPMHDRYTVL